MADWVHCNGCYTCPPSKDVKFLLTSCGHILCTNCYKQPGLPCTMCKAKCMVTPLKPNMPPDVQQFFMDPVDVAVKLHKQLLKVLDFQRSQRKRLTAYRIQKLNSAQGGDQRLQHEVRRLQEENRKMKQMLSAGAKGTPETPTSAVQRMSLMSDRRETPRPGSAGREPGSAMRRPSSAGRQGFAQVLGSRITPPPAIFQTPRTSPSPRSLAECKRSVEFNSKRSYNSQSISR